MTVMAHQIFGAIGFTKESDLNPYFQYAKAAETTFGDENFHKEAVAAEMG
jgi:alkylation response protein AidB-like acyl-CoA dehydrogenase